MGDLSRNFSEKEFKCKCGCGLFIKRQDLIDMLQTIRDAAGVPVTVNSGTRCVAHNARLKGSAPNSAHLTGEAADIDAAGMDAGQLGALVKRLYKERRIDRLTYCYIIGKEAVHVGIDRRARKNVFAF